MFATTARAKGTTPEIVLQPLPRQDLHQNGLPLVPEVEEARKAMARKEEERDKGSVETVIIVG